MDKLEQHINTKDSDVANVTIDFSSLYSVLQHNYEGNDISNIIMRLLHIYQPEDDITAYECVLKKIQSLLEDCDPYKEQLLLSMIPTPRNMPNRRIEEVFHTITGFIKLNLRENDTMFRSMFDIKNVNGIKNNNNSSIEQDFSRDVDGSDFKSSFPEGSAFRGFPESETSTFYSHINSLKHRSSNNSKSEPSKSNQCQFLFCQDLRNKEYHVPARNTSTDESHLCYSSRMDTGLMRTYTGNDICQDLCQDKIPQRLNNIEYESKTCNDVFDVDNKFNVLEKMKNDIDQNATVKPAIKDNIDRTDVCNNEDHNIFIDADDFLATMSRNLKTSLSNFLKRAQEGRSVELTEFPHIKSYPQTTDSSSLIHFTSKERKPVTSHKVLNKNFTSNYLSNISENCLSLKEQNANVSTEKNNQLSDERLKQKAFTYLAESKMKCKSQEIDRAIKTQLFPLSQNDYTIERKAVTDDMKESLYKYKMVGPSSSSINLENNYEMPSMSELAAYKKRYYDTLLNVRRAKVAVTNSLLSTTDRLIGHNDSYNSNYVYQHQHLFQQQQRHFGMRPQFSMCPATLSGLSNVYSNQYSWTRSDRKVLLLKQLRLQQQTLPLFTRSQE